MQVMDTAEEVRKLAALARIKIDDAELPAFTKDFDAIIAYVGQLEQFDAPGVETSEKPLLRNVMREDGEPHAAGAYTEKIAEQFPVREGDALSVKKILTH